MLMTLTWKHIQKGKYILAIDLKKVEVQRNFPLMAINTRPLKDMYISSVLGFQTLVFSLFPHVLISKKVGKVNDD